MDDRIPFSCKNILYLGGIPYRLMGDPVKEGNVIAYKASAPGMGLWNDVLIREYFPLGLNQGICRKASGELACEKNARELFEAKRAVFLRGEQAEAEYISSLPQGTGIKTACYHAYGTSYSVRVLPKTMTLEMFMEQNSTVLSLEKCLPWVMALAAFLEKVHRQGLLHLGVRPSQIYLLTERAVFLDHVCFWKKGDPYLPEYHGQEIACMAPEIRLGNAKDICPATDLYSVALIFCQLLYGHQPPQPFLHFEDPMQTPSVFEQALWFRKSLHILPRKRYPTAAEFNASLLRLKCCLEQAGADGCRGRSLYQIRTATRPLWRDPKGFLE